MIAFGITLGLICLHVLACVVAFSFFGLWIDLIYPVMSTVVVYLACTLYKYIVEWKARIVLENELSIAKKIQECFLPLSIPERKEFSLAAKMLTAKQVGGDLYDFLEFDDEKFGVMIGDVTGKGVPASLFMAMVVGKFKFLAKADTKPEQTLLDLNAKIIAEAKTKLFVTMFYTVFDTKEKKAHFASGGHLPMLYLPKGKKVQMLDVDMGLPIGMIKGKYSGNQTDYAPGDLFVLYTDGVTEAANKKGVMFEQQKLIEVVEKNKDKSVQDILSAIEHDVKRFAPEFSKQDDLTVIVIKVN